jgi:hypothetical protein
MYDNKTEKLFFCTTMTSTGKQISCPTEKALEIEEVHKGK